MKKNTFCPIKTTCDTVEECGDECKLLRKPITIKTLKQLEREAEEYAINDTGNFPGINQNEYNAFIAGAQSKFMAQEKIKVQIEVLEDVDLKLRLIMIEYTNNNSTKVKLLKTNMCKLQKHIIFKIQELKNLLQ